MAAPCWPHATATRARNGSMPARVLLKLLPGAPCFQVALAVAVVHDRAAAVAVRVTQSLAEGNGRDGWDWAWSATHALAVDVGVVCAHPRGDGGEQEARESHLDRTDVTRAVMHANACRLRTYRRSRSHRVMVTVDACLPRPYFRAGAGDGCSGPTPPYITEFHV